MPDVISSRSEEDRRHSAQAMAHAVVAQGAEVHTLLEEDDLAHGLHLEVGAACSGTMKCAAFQGAA